MRYSGMHKGVKQEAKMLWLKGYAPERICKLPQMPNSPSTIYRWIRENDWWGELDDLRGQIDEEFKADMLERFKRVMREHLDLLRGLGKQTKFLLRRRKRLSPREIYQLATALEKMVKTDRLIRSELMDSSGETVEQQSQW